MCTVKQITVFQKKGCPPLQTKQAQLLAGQGLLGDRHGHGGERQLTLLSQEAAKWRESQETVGLCFEKFRENLLLEGIQLGQLAAGDRIGVGDAVIEITTSEKECFAHCPRAAAGLDCLLRREARYAKVLVSGQIQPGSPVKVLNSREKAAMARYRRQLTIPRIGEAGQEKLGRSSALVIGAGGLGCPILTALGEAGLGKIGILDGDKVEITNLNRQFLYRPEDIGKSKAACAARWLQAFRPDCDVEAWELILCEENAASLLQGYDIVLTAVDHISTRMLVNRQVQKLGIPLVDGAIDGFYGTVTAVLGSQDPCLACLNPEEKEPARTGGALGTTAMVIGALQAQAALLFLIGSRGNFPSVLSYDGLYGTLEEIPAEKNRDCSVCGQKREISTTDSL